MGDMYMRGRVAGGGTASQSCVRGWMDGGMDGGEGPSHAWVGHGRDSIFPLRPFLTIYSPGTAKVGHSRLFAPQREHRELRPRTAVV